MPQPEANLITMQHSPHITERFYTMRRNMKALVATTLALGLVLAACSTDEDAAPAPAAPAAPAEAPPRDPFFAGKTLEWVVPFGAGGGTDVTARFLAPILARTIPGQPTVSPVNIPGANATIGSNLFAFRRDHTLCESVFISSASAILPWLLQNPQLLLDYRDLIGIAGHGVGQVVYVNPKATGITSLEDFVAKAKDTEFILAEQAADSVAVPLLMTFELLGITDNVQTVFGFAGRGPARVAFERGDTNINHDVSPAYLSNALGLVESGDAVPIFSAGVIVDGVVERDPNFPDLPHVGEVYELMYGSAPSGVLWDAIVATMDIAFSFQKVWWVHKDCPAEAQEDLIIGFEQALLDADYISGATDVVGDYPLIAGDAAVSKSASFTKDLDPALRDFVLDVLIENYELKDPRLVR